MAKFNCTSPLHIVFTLLVPNRISQEAEHRQCCFSCHIIPMDAEKYVYSPLENSEYTRLATLWPGDPDETMHIHLESIRDSPFGVSPYEALSYEWMASQGTIPILCDDKKLLITQNLHAALTSLRSSHKPRKLWIDAICIDQANIPEKNAQVQNMATIYKEARTVLVWLGPSDSSVPAARKLISKLSLLFRMYSPDGIARWNYAVNLPNHPERQRAVQAFEGLDLLSEPLGEFLDLAGFARTYYKRAWITQEVAVSKDLLILCGNETIPWDDMIDAMSVVSCFVLLRMLPEQVIEDLTSGP